jgi:hypothetical protein
MEEIRILFHKTSFTGGLNLLLVKGPWQGKVNGIKALQEEYGEEMIKRPMTFNLKSWFSVSPRCASCK